MDETNRAITFLFILVIILLMIIFDLSMWWYRGKEGTISMVLRRVNEKWPFFSAIIAFAMGCLFWHFFGY